MSCGFGLFPSAPYQVDITQLVQPEVVNGRCDGWEVVGPERSIAQSHSCAQPRENPPVRYTLLSAQLGGRESSVKEEID